MSFKESDDQTDSEIDQILEQSCKTSPWEVSETPVHPSVWLWQTYIDSLGQA